MVGVISSGKSAHVEGQSCGGERGSVVLITGASRGIGLALAEEFARNRHRLMVIARDGRHLEAIAANLRERYGVPVEHLALDVASGDAAQQIVAHVEAAGLEIGTLVLNAAHWSEGQVAELPTGELRQVLQANIAGVCELAAAVLPQMLARRRGEILFVGSLAGDVPSPNNAVYAATKAYLRSFALSLRSECAPNGVNVSLLAPGVVDTSFTARDIGEADIARRLLASTPQSVGWTAYRGLKARKAIIVPSLTARLLSFGANMMPVGVVGSLRRATARPRAT